MAVAVPVTSRKSSKQSNCDGCGRPLRRVSHATVKPVDLARWLATLVLPPKRETPRRLLVPFSGSGSEMIGARMAGWDEVVGIERDAEYAAIATERLARWVPSELILEMEA